MTDLLKEAVAVLVDLPFERQQAVIHAILNFAASDDANEDVADFDFGRVGKSHLVCELAASMIVGLIFE